jgi:hypothetical protein
LFLPTGVTLLLLWLGGVWMFWVPFWAKRKRAIAQKLAVSCARHNVMGVLLCISFSG